MCLSATKSIIRLNDHGCIVDVVWSPPFEGALRAASAAEARLFYDAYRLWALFLERSEELHLTTRLHPGDVLTFNNRRMLHGRTPFTLQPGTRRHLKVCQAGSRGCDTKGRAGHRGCRGFRGPHNSICFALSTHHPQGIYVNIDEFSSRVHALARAHGYPSSVIPAHLGNSQ